MLLVAGFLIGGPVAVGAEPIHIVEKGGHVTEASVIVDAPPDEVYRAVTDYARWPQMLSDVTSVEVRGERVKFHSRALGRTVTVELDNVPGREIRFRGVDGPPGGRASGRYVLQLVDGGAHTRVTAELYLDVVGFPGVFVRDAKLRDMRTEKLSRDLTDTARWFAHR